MKLTLDLIPKTSFYLNARSKLSAKKWNAISKKTAENANYKCEICNKFSLHLECHEIWQYKKGIQKLIKLASLCNRCHEVKHFGLAEIRGRRAQALSHLMKINDISKEDAEAYIQKEFQIWLNRSKFKWDLDISLLDCIII